MHERLSKEMIDIWQSADWYRAATLVERLGTQPASTPALMEKATQALLQWKNRLPYTRGTSFAERLAVDSLTEHDLLALLGETPENLQARLPFPEWLRELRSAFVEPSSYCQDGLLDKSSTKNKPTMAFLKAIWPLISKGIQQLVAGINDLAQEDRPLPFDRQTIVSLLFVNLPMRLLPKLSRTFVLEMNIARTQGRLQGETPEERFENFIQQLSSPEHVLLLFETYPVLARQLLVTIEQWVTFSLELLDHLSADWEQICPQFFSGTNPGQLVEVRFGAGDTHRGGRSVTLLQFQSGFRLVYKPRSLAIDLHFQELLLWLNAHGAQPAFQALALLDKGNHGWSTFVEERACEEEAEVQHFYERQGAYLALLHLLDAADLHAENIIAMGEHPVLIDLETLFHAPLLEQGRLFSQEPAFAELLHSVMRVGLLPHHAWGNEEARGINLSGLGGEQGQIIPRLVPQWENPGTDQMRLVGTRMETKRAQNCPTLKGQHVNVLAYRACILRGFNHIYRILCEHRQALLDEILPRFAQDEVRFVLRPTDIYARLLSESFRPELLRDGLERERHFDRLWVGITWQPHMASVIPAERADFMRGDLPLFTTRPACLDLFTSQGEVIPAFFSRSHLDTVRERVQHLNEQDRARQLWLINASFTCASLDAQLPLPQMCFSQPVQTGATREQWLESARAIGDELSRTAIVCAGRAGWSGITLVREGEWEVQAAQLDLYNGLPGITLFLAYLASLTGEERYLDLARCALRNIQALLQHAQTPSVVNRVGAFEGWGGLIYLLTQLGTLWANSSLLQQAEALAGYLPALIAHDTSFDLMAGSAGCIVALLNLHAITSSPRLLQTAILAGDRLLERASRMPIGIGWRLGEQGQPLAGMAHGAAGIAFSLFRLAEVSGYEHFRDAAHAALAYERSLFSRKQQNWLDLRKTNEQVAEGSATQHSMVAWCHGAAGIALARLATPRSFADHIIGEEQELALATTLAAAQHSGSDPTLCHGLAGLLETLLTARHILARHTYTPQIERLGQQLMTCIAMRPTLAEPQLAPWWMDAPGFMMGLAGIGYTFLRLAEPLRVPSVLLLEGNPE